jgi:hypothetical protein
LGKKVCINTNGGRDRAPDKGGVMTRYAHERLRNREQELADTKQELTDCKADLEATRAVLTAQIRQYNILKELVGELVFFVEHNKLVQADWQIIIKLKQATRKEG